MEANTITVSEILVRLLIKEDLTDKLVLDVGCGSGQLAFAIVPYARKVVGIDISESEIENAKHIAMAKGIKNVAFYGADAEAIEYREFLGEKIDAIGSNLCMSAEIVRRSSRALDVGGPFIFTCFHEDQLKELGGSRFSFSEDEMRQLLEASEFIIEYLTVEKWAIPIPKKEDAELEYANVPWARRRWNELIDYISGGGQTLTHSRLIVKARKM